MPRFLPVFVFALLACILAHAQDSGWQPCWGSDKPCEDGKFRGNTGKEQPATCSNAMLNKDGSKNEHSHDCKCMIATTDADHCPPGGIKRDYSGMGPNCSVSCREKACQCVTVCDAPGDGEKK